MKNGDYMLALAITGYASALGGLYLSGGAAAVLIAVGATCLYGAAILAQQGDSAE